jgi:hypothetical protein
MFTTRYAVSPYIKQIRFVFKGFNLQIKIMLSSFLQEANQLHRKYKALKQRGTQRSYGITFFSLPILQFRAVSDSHSAFICVTNNG